jgi:hypothetical protein
MEVLLRRLGKIGEEFMADVNRVNAAPKRDAQRAPERHDSSHVLPVGTHTRRVDSDGRVKFESWFITELLGWVPGGLHSVLADGWLLLTQPPEVVDAPQVRSGFFAGFSSTAKGVERISLRGWHTATLGLSDDRNLVIAPLPHAGALALVAPGSCALAAPGHITALLPTTTNPQQGASR